MTNISNSHENAKGVACEPQQYCLVGSVENFGTAFVSANIHPLTAIKQYKEESGIVSTDWNEYTKVVPFLIYEADGYLYLQAPDPKKTVFAGTVAQYLQSIPSNYKQKFGL